MSMYGAPSPKRQYAWSNGTAITRLDVGWKRMRAKVQTVRQYEDRHGVKRYHGTKALRHTETFASYFRMCFFYDPQKWFWANKVLVTFD